MGKAGNSRQGNAQPTTHGSPRRPRGDGRLDPVRWRRPGRGTLLRLLAVAALLATAAAVLWSQPQSCGSSTATVVSPTPSHGAAARAGNGLAAPTVSDASAAAAMSDGSAGPAVPDGSVGVPIRLADPTALTLVRPGNRVDLLRINDAGGQPTAVADRALVLRVTGADDPATGGLLLALSPQEAGQAVATSRQGFAIVIRPG